MTEVVEAKGDVGRSRRGAFPRMSLKVVEELAQAVYDVGHGERARLVSVLAKIDRTVNSSSTRTLLTSASRGYGLVDGSSTDTHLTLTERGVSLVTAKNDIDRYSAAFESLQQNEIFKAFIEKFKHRPLPPDEVAVDFLRDAFKFTEADATAAVGVFKQNLADYHLLESVGDRSVVNPPEDILQSLRSASPLPPLENEQRIQAGDVKPNSETPNSSSVRAVTMPADILPQIAFNIQIQLPGDASPEVYESIFRNISRYLLTRSAEQWT